MRVRTTAGAVAVVTVALVVGTVVLLAALRDRLTDEVRATARQRAEDVAGVLEAGTPPGTLGAAADDDALVQVLDASGGVVAASANVEGDPPVAALRPGESRRVRVPVDDDAFLAVAVGAETPAGSLVVVVARSLDDVGDSVQAVGRLLALGLPFLVLLVGVTTWAVTGRALAPVESIRREVDEVSARELHRRVPEPAGSDEVARLAATMNRMLDRLERSHARQQQFVSDASHELRSPLTSIRQHAEVAAAHPERVAAADLADTVLAETRRVEALVDDLLLLARADEQTLATRRRPVDLDDLVLDEARRLRDATPLRVDTTSVSAGRVAGDAGALRRVVRNLGDNAARHARHRVAFTVAERDGSVVLAVEDDGPGVPEAERARVFERFVRLDDARARDAGGAGLGLAIVAEVVAAHAGVATIGAGALGGARVEVVLPRLADPAE